LRSSDLADHKTSPPLSNDLDITHLKTSEHLEMYWTVLLKPKPLAYIQNVLKIYSQMILEEV